MLVTIMKTFMVCFSYHHKNTEKIASVFAKTLDAEVKMPGEVDPQGLSEYDLVGFGSGISFGKHYKVLLDFADKLPPVTQKESIYFLNQWSNRKNIKIPSKTSRSTSIKRLRYCWRV